MLDAELENEEILTKKAQAFKTIYRAICAGKNPRKGCTDAFIFEYELLSSKEYLNEVKKHYRINKKDKSSVVVSAWNLAQKYYEICTPENIELLNIIYACATNNASYVDSFYSRARSWRARAASYFGASGASWLITQDNIDARLATDPVAWNIYYELAHPTLLGNLLPTVFRSPGMEL